MTSNQQIYEWVTEKILSAMEQGVVPWHRPWSSSRADGLHKNLVTKKPYRGINQFICEATAMVEGFSSPYWLSKKQIGQKKGKIRKGQSGTMIVFWKPIKIETDEVDAKGRKVIKTIPLLRYYKVWNVDQCEGVKLPEQPEKPEFTPIERAQQVIDGMPNRPTTHHRGDRACYAPLLDSVTLPAQESFHSPEEYYSTAYHEYAHSTGHKSRLGRVTEWTGFGSDPYANEELVAELAAAMLCGTVNISTTQENSAAYIKHWSERFKNDPKLIVSAGGKAQKAADYILGIPSYEEAQEAEKEKELVEA